MKTIKKMISIVAMVLASGIAFAGSYENWEQLREGCFIETWDPNTGMSLTDGTVQFKPVEKDVYGDFSIANFDLVMKLNQGCKDGVVTRFSMVNGTDPIYWMVWVKNGVPTEYWIGVFGRR